MWLSGEKMAGQETDPKRKEELKKIAEICRWVPAHAPRTYWEAVACRARLH